MNVSFTIFYADTPSGEYKTHTAQITGWPVHSHGRPWEYGAYGNWNPAPLVHPNGPPQTRATAPALPHLSLPVVWCVGWGGVVGC